MKSYVNKTGRTKKLAINLLVNSCRSVTYFEEQSSFENLQVSWMVNEFFRLSSLFVQHPIHHLSLSWAR